MVDLVYLTLDLPQLWFILPELSLNKESIMHEKIISLTEFKAAASQRIKALKEDTEHLF